MTAVAARALLMIAGYLMADAEPTPAPRERIGVLILPADGVDAGLADNLTEVAIAKLAEAPAYELVGAREIQRRLAATGAGPIALQCLDQPACLARIGAVIGAHRVVSGHVRAEGSDGRRFLLALALNDVATGRVLRQFFRAPDQGLPSLIDGVRVGLDELFRPQLASGQIRFESSPEGASVVVDDRYRGLTPLWVSPLDPGPHRVRLELSGHFPWKNDLVLAPGQDLAVSIAGDQLTRRRTWAPYAAYGSAAGALLSFAGAGLFGTLAHVRATGATRAQAQEDLELRKTYAQVTNGLLISGGALALLSAALFIGLRRDIAGE